MAPSTRAMGCNVRDSMKLNSQKTEIKTPQTGRGDEKRNVLAVATLKIDHEIGQRFHPFNWHGVIDRGAHTANNTVPF